MPRIEAVAVVDAPVAVAFAVSQTYGEVRYRWDPFVREQRLLDDSAAAGKGVRTWTRSRHGLVMVSEYVTFRPPLHVGMRMVEGPFFFLSFSGGWHFAERPTAGPSHQAIQLHVPLRLDPLRRRPARALAAPA